MSAEMETDQVQNGTRIETNGSGDQPEIKKAKVTEGVGKDKTSKRLVENHLDLLSIFSLQEKLRVLSYRSGETSLSGHQFFPKNFRRKREVVIQVSAKN